MTCRGYMAAVNGGRERGPGQRLGRWKTYARDAHRSLLGRGVEVCVCAAHSRIDPPGMTKATVLLVGLMSAYAILCMPVRAAAITQASCAPGAPTCAAEGPTEVVRAAALGMLDELDKNRDAYRRDPARVAKLVDKYLVPHFDTELSARLVLGQHWRDATPEQRKQFIDVFCRWLLTRYGNALVEFTSDRLEIIPTRVADRDHRATVRTKVKGSNGEVVEVDYQLRRTSQGWKAWNVVVEGIDYVNSYREDFGPQIEKQGIDAVIKRLESAEEPAKGGAK